MERHAYEDSSLKYSEFILAFQLQFEKYEVESEHFRWEKEKRHFMKTVGLLFNFLVAFEAINKTNDLILNLTPENVTQHSRIVTATRKGSSTPTKMSKIIGRQVH